MENRRTALSDKALAGNRTRGDNSEKRALYVRRSKVHSHLKSPLGLKQSIDPIHLTSSSELSWMHHIGGQCHCALFSEGRTGRIHVNLCADQNGEHGTVAEWDARARGQ